MQSVSSRTVHYGHPVAHFHDSLERHSSWSPKIDAFVSGKPIITLLIRLEVCEYILGLGNGLYAFVLAKLHHYPMKPDSVR
jgi:hypothetical protein